MENKQKTLFFDKSGHIRLSKLMCSRKGMWLLAWIIGFVTALATVGLLALSGWFITASALAGVVSLSTAYTFNYLAPSGIIRFFAIIRTAGRYGERMSSHNAVLALLKDLRSSCFSWIQKNPAVSRNAMREMHRLTENIDNLDSWPLLIILPWAWGLVLQFFFFGIVYLLAPELLIWLIPPTLLCGIFIPFVGSFHIVKLVKQEIEVNERRRLDLLKPLSIMTALLQWGQWRHFADIFKLSSQKYNLLKMLQQIVITRIVLLQQISMLICLAFILWQGEKILLRGEASVAVLLAIFLMALGILEFLLPLGMQIASVGLSISAKNQINEILVNHEESPDQQYQKVMAPYQLDIHNLSARHANALNGLIDLSFSVRSGEALLIRGVTGAGKSTLLSVLARELKALQGEVTINEIPYEQINLAEMIGFLGQEIDIFNLSLRDNLRLAKPKATEDELWEVLDKVSLSAWAKEEGLDRLLGEYGASVSGGQARRIALARLLLKKSPILLLDEPFAGLDKQTHISLLKMLREEMASGILIISSHVDDNAEGMKELIIKVKS